MNIVNGFLKFLIVISSIGIILAVYFISTSMYSYHKSSEKYKEINTIYQEERKKGNSDVFKKMSSINEDYLGWLSLPNTNIHYPIVKTDNNDFYLSHNFYLEKDKAGAIFMDSKNSSTKLDQNTIIYGHDMKDGSMFGNLSKYLDETYTLNHSLIQTNFLDNTYDWEIFSVSIANESDSEWMKVSFPEQTEFEDFLSKIKNNSSIFTNTKIEQAETILTLSTCSTDDTERLVIHAKLLTKGRETDETN
ncbi:class B sortase [Bacillus sp. T3]|uniref:class B sortase n=1 Tax=Bacillus sp. T3 TaxID=467262 RepID=UPI00298127FB|nr:class B sortase [Bacillus sp. T3]